MSENHDPGDENDRERSVPYCPHCGERYWSSNGWCTPVLKPLDWSSFEAKPLSNEKSYEEVLTCCDNAECRMIQELLARKLAENLDYKLDQRRYNLMIKRAKNAGV